MSSTSNNSNGRPVDWRYHLSLRDVQAQSWNKIITECIGNFNINLRCPVCGQEPRFARSGQRAKHYFSESVYRKYQALVADMRACRANQLTGSMLNEFRNRWWACEDEYLADNLTAICHGLNGTQNRDYNVQNY